MNQKACSKCRKRLASRRVLCAVCGNIHVHCSGLSSSRECPPDFICPGCTTPEPASSSGPTQAFADLSLDPSKQANCSHCRKPLRGYGIWCRQCAYIHVSCSGLRSSDDWTDDFVCQHCTSAPEIAILQTEEIHTGTTQAFSSMTISAPEDFFVTEFFASVKSVRCRIMTRTPRTCRILCAKALSKCITDVNSDPHNLKHWKRLLLLPYICLKRPDHGGKNCKSLSNMIHQQIKTFLENDIDTLITPQRTKKRARKHAVTSTDETARRIVEKI